MPSPQISTESQESGATDDTNPLPLGALLKRRTQP